MYRFNFNHGGGASRSLKAFTLAEVLITLAIIGVVAALTIPSVVTNYQNQEIATALKKTYTTLASITNLAIKDHGPISGWEIGKDNTGEDSLDYAKRYIIPYLRIAKDCGLSNEGECEYKYNYRFKYEGQTYDYEDSLEKFAKFYLPDGVFVAVKSNNGTNSNGRQLNGMFTIDVNGKKKPNMYGQDVFTFSQDLIRNGIATGGKLLPQCAHDSNGQCSLEPSIKDTAYGCNNVAYRTYCPYVIMANGWKIPSKEEYANMGGEISKYPW
ncbi:MAG: type II secretion system protein [Cyanobacteria bacterium SIG30]|nr:type II secretion system protein [Cyanobacteria bacterium SIG30]